MMRLLPFPRRHRVLWLIAAFLGVSAWGFWLVSTGRTTDYANGYTHISISRSALPPTSPAPGVPDVAELLLTSSAGVPRSSATATATEVATSVSDPAAAPTASARRADHAAPDVAVSSRADLTGMADPIVFARAAAGTVLSYAPGADLGARADVVMAVAALPPIGSPAELAADLRRFDPDSVTRYGGGTLTFIADSVEPSSWAAGRLDRLGLPAGSFAIDVTGSQLIALPGHAPVSVSVTVGITGACPPALAQCEIDRIFPRTVAQELGS